jgi:ribulose-phosphate 3-epimerase
MQIYPVINCENLSCVERRIQTAKTFLPQGGTIHFDIADGTFTKNITWNEADELKPMLDAYDSALRPAVHLMVDKPESWIERWLRNGAVEVAAHLEALSDRDFFKDLCNRYNAEPVIAVSPETPSRTALGYVDDFKKLLILGVDPGLSGQVFQTAVLDKIKEIKWAAPDVIIMVDGGVNMDTIKSIREAGADIALSESYLFEAGDPAQAYFDLSNA